jgi:hypothetical protein
MPTSPLVDDIAAVSILAWKTSAAAATAPRIFVPRAGLLYRGRLHPLGGYPQGKNGERRGLRADRSEAARENGGAMPKAPLSPWQGLT